MTSLQFSFFSLPCTVQIAGKLMGKKFCLEFFDYATFFRDEKGCGWAILDILKFLIMLLIFTSKIITKAWKWYHLKGEKCMWVHVTRSTFLDKIVPKSGWNNDSFKGGSWAVFVLWYKLPTSPSFCSTFIKTLKQMVFLQQVTHLQHTGANKLGPSLWRLQLIPYLKWSL